jgi:hypothetical protein
MPKTIGLRTSYIKNALTLTKRTRIKNKLHYNITISVGADRDNTLMTADLKNDHDHNIYKVSQFI